MNAAIETVNSAGRTFVEFAMPMSIQSSVLILVLLLLDVVLRRRVRAVFRYWVWMLVLLKLVLPPSLGSPMSIGAWLGDKLEPPVVTLGETPAPQHEELPSGWQPPMVLSRIQEMHAPAPSERLPTEVCQPDSAIAAETTPDGAMSVQDVSHPPAPALSWQALVLLAWLAVASALLLLLLQRAWFVRGLVAQAQEAPPRLQAALDQCRSRMGVVRLIAVCISPNASSPAVCGLVRPVILIPESLAPRLQPHDLQAVLLHELAHIRRGDLWINLVQTLLQIVYFYNPFLWLANAVIRRVREQAVDEAVLVAMGETSRDYPETLLNVARLAFHRRPALSLRLIGVVESKSALRSRIKHILARPLPKTAKLGVLGLVSVFLVGVVLLPMAKARPLTDRARNVLSLADEEARRLNHGYVGTEHILLALARQDEAISAKVLANLGADIDTLRAEVNKFIQPGPGPVTRRRLPHMPRAERVMQYAREEAKSLRHDYIGTEHVLLGLMREPEGIAAQVLSNLGVTPEQIKREVLNLVRLGREPDIEVTMEESEAENGRGTGGGAPVEPSRVVAELPNGIAVELLGVCEYPSRGKRWWRPDGAPLDEAPYDKPGAWVYPGEPNTVGFEVALQVRDLPERWEATVESLGNASSNSADPPYKAGQRLPDLRWLMLEAGPNQTTCAIRCNVVEPWQVVARTSPETDPSQRTTEGSVVFSGIRENSGSMVRVTVSGHMVDPGYDSPLYGRELRRVVAIKKDGQVEESLFGGLHSAESPGQATVCFPGLSLNEIKEFQFQVRAATYVAFRNIPLHPGLKTDVRIDVGPLDAAVAVPEGMVGTWRYENSIGDDEQMAVFPDSRVVVLYSNGHRDETRYDNGFITLGEYHDIRVRLVLDDNGTILQYAGGPDTDIFGKRWKRIDPEPEVELLASLTEAAPQSVDAAAQLRADSTARSTIVLPDVDHEAVMLDLASGQLVEIPRDASETNMAAAILEIGRGDLIHDGNALILVRNAASEQAERMAGTPFSTCPMGRHLPQVLQVTTAEGRRYEVTVLAADEEGCTLKYSLLSGDAGAGGGALVESHSQGPPGIVAELPNGVTVEFLAYSQLASEGLKWWTPQGEPTTVPGLYEADVEGHGTLLALRIEPEPEAGVSAWRVQPPNVRDELKPVWQPNNGSIWLVPLGEGRSHANVEIAAQVRDPVVIKTASVQQASSQDGFWVKDVTPIDADSTAFTAHGASSYSGVPMGVQVLAAIDSAGQIHAVRRIPGRSIEEQMGNPFGESPRLQVDLPVDRFAKVVVEGYSERAGRVKFRNLSLRPGQPTEVHIEVEAEQRGPWWHPSEYDAKLEELGRALSEQAEARGGRYPADLAALQAYFTDTEWNWLQEHAVYLVASEPATKAETVPLAYEKTLLPAGFGTYVLFGDGDVSFQTPSELEQLGITQAIRTVPRRMPALKPVTQTEADEAPPPAVKAELPNGVTVEFLAYSHLVPRGGLFWFDPRGQETTIPGVYEADVEGLGTILALRVQPSEARLVVQVYRGPDSQNIEKHWQLPGTDIWLLALGQERNFANLRIITELTQPPEIETIALTEENLGQLVEVNQCGIASIVDLQVVESFPADMLMNQMGYPSMLGTGVATAESVGLEDMAEPPMLQFSYIRAPDSYQEVVAFLDKEGRTHPVERVRVDSTGTTYQGRVWPSRLAGILVEVSAVHAADVRFRNISLTPERVTDIQIEPAAKQEVSWKLSYRHFVLEAFTNSLRGFRERHGGRFPASLADLQSSHDPEAFRWITTHMAYVGADKSPDDDPRSVIAYDKTLLTQGRATYVFYSDDQLEFESLPELREVSILPPNQNSVPPDSARLSSGDGARSDATGEPRFTVQGVVTDTSGQPMEGVWVNVDCGFERPQRAGRTLTDEKGRYTLHFNSAWVVADADPYGVGIQPAFVYAQKEGFYETSLRHKGNLAMAGKTPGPDEQRFVAGGTGVILVNKPYELNFAMAPAALLTGELVGADGRPMPNRDIYLHSDQIYPPGRSYVHIQTHSDGTFGPCTVPCTSFRFSCPEPPLAPSDEIAFSRPGTWRLTLKCRETDPQRAELLVEDLQGPTDGPPNSLSTASQPTATGLFGRVVDPNGAPAPGAQVALCTSKIGVVIRDGRLEPPRTSDMEKGQIVETDAQGRFRFESEPNDGFSLVAAHDAGFALIGSEEFDRDRVIRLQRWGHIEGRVAEGREPAGDKIWMGGLPNSTWFEHRRDYRYETLCDAERRFAFGRVPPGWFEVGYLVRTGDSTSSLTARTPVVVEPGRTATVKLGGEGRPVIGQFVAPPDWEGPVYFGAGLRALDTVRPERPAPADYDQMTQRQQQEWLKRWYETPEAKEYRDAVWHNPDQRHYTFRIANDGSFRIEDVIPGKYNLTVYLEERFSGEGRPEEIGGYSGTVEVPPMDEAYSDDPLDVGGLVLRMNTPLHVGDMVPLFEATTLDGRNIRLIDYRGRFVLLNIWSPVFNPELDRIRELYATYGSTGQLQVIGLGGTDTLEEVSKYVEEHDIEWPEIYFGPDWDTELLRHLGGQMQILLIDPDGKIVATWLRDEKLTDTVREAVEKADLGLSGRVVGPNGEPVAGATVMIVPRQDMTRQRAGAVRSWPSSSDSFGRRERIHRAGFALTRICRTTSC